MRGRRRRRRAERAERRAARVQYVGRRSRVRTGPSPFFSSPDAFFGGSDAPPRKRNCGAIRQERTQGLGASRTTSQPCRHSLAEQAGPTCLTQARAADSKGAWTTRTSQPGRHLAIRIQAQVRSQAKATANDCKAFQPSSPIIFAHLSRTPRHDSASVQPALLDPGKLPTDKRP